MPTHRRFVASLVLALSTCACTPKPPSQPATGPGDPERGRRVYLSTCIACHNADPTLEGPLGPPVKGSPLELIRARVVEGTYPPGYKPKRDTRLMKPLPQLETSVRDLAAYLDPNPS